MTEFQEQAEQPLVLMACLVDDVLFPQAGAQYPTLVGARFEVTAAKLDFPLRVAVLAWVPERGEYVQEIAVAEPEGQLLASGASTFRAAARGYAMNTAELRVLANAPGEHRLGVGIAGGPSVWLPLDLYADPGTGFDKRIDFEPGEVARE